MGCAGAASSRAALLLLPWPDGVAAVFFLPFGFLPLGGFQYLVVEPLPVDRLALVSSDAPHHAAGQLADAQAVVRVNALEAARLLLAAAHELLHVVGGQRCRLLLVLLLEGSLHGVRLHQARIEAGEQAVIRVDVYFLDVPVDGDRHADGVLVLLDQAVECLGAGLTDLLDLGRVERLVQARGSVGRPEADVGHRFLLGDALPDRPLSAAARGHLGGGADALVGQGLVARARERDPTLPARLLDAERRHGPLAAARRHDEAGDDDAVLLTALQPVPLLEEEVAVALVLDLQLADLGLLLLTDGDELLVEALIEGQIVAVVLVLAAELEYG